MFSALAAGCLGQRARWPARPVALEAAGKAGWIRICLKTPTGDGLDGFRPHSWQNEVCEEGEIKDLLFALPWVLPSL